jgi:peroxiredoxin
VQHAMVNRSFRAWSVPAARRQDGSRMLADVCSWLLATMLAITGLPTATSAQQNPDGQLPLGSVSEPLPFLLRDDVVLAELNLTGPQRDALLALRPEVDRLLWPARNRSAEESQRAWQAALDRCHAVIQQHLQESQRNRLDEITIWLRGTHGLLHEDVAEKIRLTAAQRSKIQSLIDHTATEITKLRERAANGEPREPLDAAADKARSTEAQQIIKVMSTAQQSAWLKLAGKKIDVSKLGFVTISAPELIATANDWLDGMERPTSLSGQVTVVHFFANGCINCIHNYEHYLAWQNDFTGRGLQIIGIHTPETSAERDRSTLQSKVADAGFQFPILVDNEGKNWDAWGNSIWPAVYLVDHHGQIRYWWYGELNWQGQTGEQQLRRRIEQLLADAAPSSTEPRDPQRASP